MIGREVSSMEGPQPAGGDILVYAIVHDPKAKARLRYLLEELPGERVDTFMYEVFTTDWDEGLWDEEVEKMREIIDPDTDTLIFWKVIDGKLVRTCIAGRFV
jgi:hypothetical protein